MLIRKVETFLKEHGMPATKFGRLAAHDPRFVLDLRMGRIPRAKTEARTLAWMAQYNALNTAPYTDQPLQSATQSAAQPDTQPGALHHHTQLAAQAKEFAHV